MSSQPSEPARAPHLSLTSRHHNNGKMAASKSWADDVEGAEFPARTETTDANGVTTIVEYRLNDEGKKVKVTRKIKRTLVKTTIQAEEKDEESEAMRKQLANKKVTCRYCSGDHFTAHCPYKDTLGAALGDGEGGPPSDLPTDATAPGGTTVNGKYVPPSLRSGGGTRPGETMNGLRGGDRDAYPTLRVTNLSEDSSDADMWELFGRFAQRGRINRIYVGKDPETGLCKGFGFVSFEDRADAEAALKKVHGLPYDHLILQVQWSVPKGERPEGGARA
ncbi:translation initiation factor eIF-3 subunit 4 [Rhodotorula toruloides]|uniref:Eukaryotic translation initiation factor 3 subunit G n=1 Tax=Rhodotorula toruloides TaxID=5286 RepID=A0A511KLJ4_RHOTO|nr:translation initiation factor eIF-3 subunit 4 [Rhodotorula toruloides]